MPVTVTRRGTASVRVMPPIPQPTSSDPLPPLATPSRSTTCSVAREPPTYIDSNGFKSSGCSASTSRPAAFSPARSGHAGPPAYRAP